MVRQVSQDGIPQGPPTGRKDDECDGEDACRQGDRQQLAHERKPAVKDRVRHAQIVSDGGGDAAEQADSQRQSEHGAESEDEQYIHQLAPERRPVLIYVPDDVHGVADGTHQRAGCIHEQEQANDADGSSPARDPLQGLPKTVGAVILKRQAVDDEGDHLIADFSVRGKEAEARGEHDRQRE